MRLASDTGNRENLTMDVVRCGGEPARGQASGRALGEVEPRIKQAPSRGKGVSREHGGVECETPGRGSDSWGTP